jgi:hypothetical protein
MYKFIATLVLFVAALGNVHAHLPPGARVVKNTRQATVQSRAEVCANSLAQVDQEINNVRARLLAGGDCWWDLSDGRYIVPKVDPSTGQKEVSSIYAGSVWLGGRDPGGNLKLACQNYRTSGGIKNDFWPGPLNEDGQTEQATCDLWDRHFRVTGDEIRRHLRNIANGNFNPDDIPRGVKGWPATGNPYFEEVWGFELPNTSQGLAGFFDTEGAGGIGTYDPLQGDYPSIEIRGCDLTNYPDEMLFWIYNDQGGGAPHARTGGDAIQMEVQVQAFGYVSNDELNDMTFQRYKLINRATEYIDSTYFAMWTDPDLGCAFDDYIGCDTALDLMYVYNQDAADGETGITCSGNTPTYGTDIPILGVDYFRGPLRQIIDSTGEVREEEIGMSSFTYHNGGGNAPPGTEDPGSDDEFYNLLKGLWRDGQPVTEGGNGRGGAIPTKYVFPDPPNDVTGWSMCTAILPTADRRTLQATGPFRLNPGALNELIIGVPWVPDIEYPCPDVEAIFRADKLAQGLFNSCFKPQNGPDAPFVDWVELDQQVIAVLSYPDSAITNNFNNTYEEEDIFAPEALKGTEEIKYRFQGYKIYQLKDPNVSNKDFEINTELSRLVAQVDIKDSVVKIYNWLEVENPNPNAPSNKYYVPELKVRSENKGIRNTFNITEDLFATGNNKKLINHKKYYYAAIAYGFNNYEQFDPTASPARGQQRSYLVGRRAGYGSGQVSAFTVIPRPIVDRALNSAYGDGVEITRQQGVGTNRQFLDLTDESRKALIDGNIQGDTTLTYKRGRGPLNITIFNPFEVKDGEFELVFTDKNPNDDVLDDSARWELRNLADSRVIRSARTIAEINEQIVAEFGFSVNISQGEEPGEGGERNGAIGAEIEYKDPNNAWINGIADQGDAFFDFVKTAGVDEDVLLDPKQDLSTLGTGFFVPYHLADWRYDAYVAAEYQFARNGLITPAWTNKGKNNANALGSIATRRKALNRLPNVDIVFTSDKSLWSRCVVIESGAYQYVSDSPFPKDPSLQLEAKPGGVRRNFDVRYSLSVGKDDSDGDGKPDPDGAVYPDRMAIPAAQRGKPAYGLGWFPGYAIDVETGTRLNVFFGENSAFMDTVDNNKGYTGRDMLWNPTEDVTRESSVPGFDYYNFVLGSQHWVYVTYTRYDSCYGLMTRLTPEFAPAAATDQFKIQVVDEIAWTGMIGLQPGQKFKSLRDGLIANDAIVKLRVDNKYQTWYDDPAVPASRANPRYTFRIKGQQSQPLDEVLSKTMLDSVKVVPNPYYGFSQYETSNFSNTVKITNLPAKCTVTIYSLDGKFIRQYTRNEQYSPYSQIAPDIEWDIKNSKGIPVASGVYLIHVVAPEVGERTVKWFGITRQFDPTGL